MDTKGLMLSSIESCTSESLKYYPLHMLHRHYVAMKIQHLSCPQQAENWYLFFMMKAPFTPMKTGMDVGEKGKVVLKPKGQGRGIMVSDFIEEHFGYLALTDDRQKFVFLIFSSKHSHF